MEKVEKKIVKYDTADDLPPYLKDEHGNAILVHGYLMDARLSGMRVAEERLAAVVLSDAVNQAQKLSPTFDIKEWARQLCRNLGIRDLKQ